MFQLLIVDDEEESLEWLKEIFEGVESEEICVYTAISGRKAIQILNRVKCDVVLTDIKMPGMDGMELYSHVKENWPMARVVFLTGYGSHEILYKVAQDREARYLVKTETPEKIIDTVLEAYREARGRQDSMLAAERREALLQRAQYWLQKELVERMIFGMEEAVSQEQLDEIEIPVDRRYPVLIFFGRVGVEKGMLAFRQQEDILFITRENMPGIMKASAYILESSYVFGIVQPKLTGEYMDWGRALHVCVGALENIQEICERGMEIRIPFGICGEAVPLEEAGRIYNLLKERLPALGREMGVFVIGTEGREEKRIDNRAGLVRIPLLASCLEQGDYAGCVSVLKEITLPLSDAVSMHDITALELYYNISMAYLKHINANGWGERLPFYVGLYPLTRVDGFACWREAVDYLARLTEAFFKLAEESSGNRNLDRIEQYIHGHLEEDLSLQALADLGGFNASYLSRIFKQRYRCNLYEYIMRERIAFAKELLTETDEKIYRIGEKTGYQTVSSFNRVFKKSEGISPAEYRKRYQAKK